MSASRFGDWEVVIGLETHAQLLDPIQNFLGRIDCVWRRTKHSGQRC